MKNELIVLVLALVVVLGLFGRLRGRGRRRFSEEL